MKGFDAIFTCHECGNPFEARVTPSLLQVRTYEFCHVVCRNRAMSRRQPSRKKREYRCEWCYKPFRAYKKKMYCSEQCKDHARRNLFDYIGYCEQCGNVFKCRDGYDQKRKKYCSKECMVKGKQSGSYHPCAHCGEPVYVRPHHEQWDRHFCSKKCRLADGWTVGDPSKRDIFTCEWCGGEFESWVYRPNRFCSNQCRSEFAARQPKPNARKPESYVTLECEICGDDFTVHNCLIEDPNRNPRFCSLECTAVWRSEAKRGEGNPNWVGGVEHITDRGPNWGRQKRRVQRRDKCTCQHCAKKQEEYPDLLFDVHHIIPYRLFDGDYKRANRLTNLVFICRDCHAKADNEFRKKERKYGLRFQLL